jgi:S-adenosylmethionine:tRNA ribosyltransferase-isomerase
MKIFRLGKMGQWDCDACMSLLTKDFDYHLPEDLIASRPLADRAASRMMVLHRAEQRIEHRMFRDFPDYVGEGDLLMLNNTRVIPARMFSDDGVMELLYLEAVGETTWRCLAKPGKKLREGGELWVGGCRGEVVEVFENGDRAIRWDEVPDMEKHGHLALPHYMNRADEESDRERYQTVYAKEEGAIAAPTAGLHFTPEMLARLRHDFLTLHVGVGTFRPVKAERPEEHEMHTEKYHIGSDVVTRVNEARRVIAVGTTVTRVLEHLAKTAADEMRLPLGEHQGETNIFIYPPYECRVVDALLTNFHLPQSTLMMLISALAGREFVLSAYEEAVKEKYRFYSYGDCMLIL